MTDGWKGFEREWLCLINIIFWYLVRKAIKKFRIASVLAAVQTGKLIQSEGQPLQSVQIHVNVILHLLNVLSDCYLHT